MAFERLTEGGERREVHRLGAAALEYRQVGGRDSYAIRELAQHIFCLATITSLPTGTGSSSLVDSACKLRRFYVTPDGLGEQHAQLNTMSATPRMDGHANPAHDLGDTRLGALAPAR